MSCNFKPEGEAVIRVADLNDLERLCELFKELHAYHVKIKPEKFRMPGDDFFRETMTDFLKSDEWITLVHESGGVIDGYTIFKAFNTDSPDEHPRRLCFITHFTVTVNARRKGIGKQLMDKVCECARSVNCDYVRLGVNALNADAIAFDKAMGFEDATIMMEKRL